MMIYFCSWKTTTRIDIVLLQNPLDCCSWKTTTRGRIDLQKPWDILFLKTQEIDLQILYPQKTLISTSLMYKILDCDDGPHHKHDVHAFQALQLIFGLLHK